MKTPRPIKQAIVYDNCKMYAPDGVLLANCSSKRMKWYIKRNLAIWVGENQFKLLFEPNGNGNASDVPYMLEQRENRCVICGTSEDLTLHHVVPSSFRKHLPEEYKSRNHFDVVCCCAKCHDQYERKANWLRRSLIDSLVVVKKEKQTPDPEKLRLEKARRAAQSLLERARRAAQALLRHYDQIPEEKRLKLFQTLSEYFGKQVAVENWKECVEQSNLPKLVQIHVVPCSGSPPSVDVYKAYMERIGDVFAFIVMWRKHFLEHAEPKFLSKDWLDNYNKRMR